MLSNSSFENTLSGAVMGNNECLEIIIDIYKPLIDKLSIVDGIYDEDLRQYMLEHLIKNIRKFDIRG